MTHQQPDGPIEWTNPDDAQAVMESNFIGPADAAWCFRINLDPHAVKTLPGLPYHRSVLVRSAMTHLLVFDLGLSIREIREMVRGNMLRLSQALESEHGETIGDKPLFAAQDWYVDLPFAFYPASSHRWRLIAKEPLTGTFDRHFQEQLDLVAQPVNCHGHGDAALRAGDQVPTAREVVYASLLYRLTRGEYPFSDKMARCIDPVTDHSRATVGCFHGTIVIGQANEEKRSRSLGLATARVVNRPRD